MKYPSITNESKELFVALAEDAPNWSGDPLVELTPAERGNLTQLKRAGLLTTIQDDGCVFAHFTELGRDFAASMGYTIYTY